MERIINYRDIPTDKKNDVLNVLEQIGFFPAYGGVKTNATSYGKIGSGFRTPILFCFS